METLLAGDTALVTGAGNGIGRAIAEEIAAEGAKVLLADIDATGGEEAAAALRARGYEAHFVACDLSAPGSAQTLMETAIHKLGRISLFVHAASPRRQEADTALAVSSETWRTMLSVNLEAGFFLAQMAARHMRDTAAEGPRGRMLFVTSLHAETPRNLPHYSASKAGMTMLMKEFARYLGPSGIRVNAIAPGAIGGGGFQANPSLAAKIPLGRIGISKDVARMAIAILAERFAGYVTGTTIVVDGGLALHNWIEPPE